MLANDSVTVAIEIPIWLDEADIALLEREHGIALAPRVGTAERALTGHIDFLQVRNGCVDVLDYKPDARTNKPISQLAIYALAFTRRVPSLKLSTSSARGSTRMNTAKSFCALFSDDDRRNRRPMFRRFV